jgi:hypothetical protein
VGPVAMRMFGDNQSALALIKNPVHHQRTKHIDIIHHAVRERVVRGEVMFEYCPTQDMLADVFTKGLPAPVFQRLRSALQCDEGCSAVKVAVRDFTRGSSGVAKGKHLKQKE